MLLIKSINTVDQSGTEGMTVLNGPSISPQSGGAPQSLVILLHGYGADGHNLIDLGHVWGKYLPHTEFIAPHAPHPCKDNPAGYEWFGLPDFTPKTIRSGLDSVREPVAQYILDSLKARQLTPQNLCLVGFSQGCMLALDLLFLLPGLKGLIGYSGAFFPPLYPEPLISHPNILLVHGEADTVVPPLALDNAIKRLASFDIHPMVRRYPGLAHSINDDGLEEGRRFLHNNLYDLPIEKETYS